MKQRCDEEGVIVKLHGANLSLWANGGDNQARRLESPDVCLIDVVVAEVRLLSTGDSVYLPEARTRKQTDRAGSI